MVSNAWNAKQFSSLPKCAFGNRKTGNQLGKYERNGNRDRKEFRAGASCRSRTLNQLKAIEFWRLLTGSGEDLGCRETSQPQHLRGYCSQSGGFDADVPQDPLPAPAADPKDGLLVSCSSFIIREVEGFNFSF